MATPPVSTSHLMDVPSNSSLDSMDLATDTHEWQWQLKTTRGCESNLASKAPHLHFMVSVSVDMVLKEVTTTRQTIWLERICNKPKIPRCAKTKSVLISYEICYLVKQSTRGKSREGSPLVERIPSVKKHIFWNDIHLSPANPLFSVINSSKKYSINFYSVSNLRRNRYVVGYPCLFWSHQFSKCSCAFKAVQKSPAFGRRDLICGLSFVQKTVRQSEQGRAIAQKSRHPK